MKNTKRASWSSHPGSEALSKVSPLATIRRKKAPILKGNQHLGQGVLLRGQALRFLDNILNTPQGRGDS